MRIVVSVDDSNGLDSVVSPHFGRCPHYIFVDLDGSEVRAVNAVDNPYHGHHQPGQVPAFINAQGADVMLAGGMGRRAVGLFREYGIEAAFVASENFFQRDIQSPCFFIRQISPPDCTTHFLKHMEICRNCKH